MNRAISAIRPTTISAAAIAVLGGVPYCLLAYVGNPLPTIVPSAADIGNALSNGQIDPQTWIKALACVVWVAWALLTLSLVVEVAAVVRGGTAAAVRGLGSTQWLASRLVGQISLVAAVVFQSSAGVASALPAPPLASIHHDSSPDARAAASTSTPASSDDDAAVHQPSAVDIEVGRHESLWGLAETHLGDGDRWSEIRDANIGRIMPDGVELKAGFTTIQEGWTLRIPGGDMAPSSEGDSGTSNAPDRIGTWKVEPGDHFWQIADTVLTASWGRAVTDAEIHPYWVEIVNANIRHLTSPGSNPDLIYPEEDFDIFLPPLPSDTRAGGDAAATTTLHPLDDLDQFTSSVTLDTSTASQLPPAPVVEVPADADRSDEDTIPGITVVPTTAVPTTAAPVVTAVVVEVPEASPESRRTERDLRPIALGIFGTAIGGGALMAALRSRRRQQAARRRPGTTITDPPIEASDFEKRIRPVGSTDGVRWLTATNQFLSHRLALHPESRLPAVVAMRAGHFGVELLLDDACPPVQGFIDGGEKGMAWRLHPDLDLRMLESEAAHAHSYCPGLLTVGSTDAGDLLLDFEQLGSVSVTGDEETIIGWMRSIAAGVTSVSWAQRCRVVAIGVDDSLAGIEQVVVPADPHAWSQEIKASMTATAQRLDASPYEQRVKPGELHYPTLVLIGPGNEGIAQFLAPIGDLAYSPFAVIAAAPLTGEARIEMFPGRATIEPLGIEFVPVTTESAAIGLAVDLLAATGDTITVPSELLDDPGPPELLEGPAWLYDGTFDEPVDFNNGVDDLFLEPPLQQPEATELPDATVDLIVEDSEHQSAARSTERDLPAGLESTPLVDIDLAKPVDVPPQVAGVDDSSDLETAATPPGSTVIEGGAPESPDVDEAPAELDDKVDEIDVRQDVVPSALTPSQPIGEFISSVLAGHRVEVRILQSVPEVIGLDESPQAKLEAVIVYLAYHRTVSSDRLRQAFWPTAANRKSCDNAMATIRSLLGTAMNGDQLLSVATNTGRFAVDDELGCDWSRVEVLVNRAKSVSEATDKMALLEAAVGLITGRPAADAAPRHYSWILDDEEVYTRIETMLTDASYQLGRLAIDASLPDLAWWAAEQALRVVHGQEALYRIQMEAADMGGNRQGVDDAYRAAVRSAQALSEWEEVQPETEELYNKLTRKLSAGSARAGVVQNGDASR